MGRWYIILYNRYIIWYRRHTGEGLGQTFYYKQLLDAVTLCYHVDILLGCCTLVT